MPLCTFCDCAERIIDQNEHAFVILSNPRKVQDHLLVIPRRHVLAPWELSHDEQISIDALIRIHQPRLAEKYGGCDMRQHYRPFMQQSRYKVDHVHYHLLPRSLNDRLYEKVERFETALFEDIPQEHT